MQQLTKHLSLETSRRASSGSLLRLENQGNLRTGKAGKGRILKEQKLEKTAVAKVPILVLPIQVFLLLQIFAEGFFDSTSIPNPIMGV